MQTYNKQQVDKLIQDLRNEFENRLEDERIEVGEYIVASQPPKYGTWSKISDYDGRFLRLGSTAGTTCEEELPNITGNLQGKTRMTISNGSFGTDTDGALSYTLTNAESIRSDGNAYGSGYFTFNAHNSNNIYKDGGKVQPKGYDLCL